MSRSQVGETYKPFGRPSNLSGGDTRDTITVQVIGINRGEEQVTRIDVKCLTTESQRDTSICLARDGETALSVLLGSSNGGVDSSSVTGGCNDEGSAGVENGGTTLKTEVLAVGRNAHGAFPETFSVHVRERDKRVSVKFAVIKTTKCDLSIVQVVGKTRNLVRCNGIADEPILCQ